MRSIVALSLLALAVNARFLQECTNVGDGLYPLGPCEPKFLTCSGGIARVMDCPADLFYNEDGEMCDWEHNVVGCGGAGNAYGADNRQSDEASGSYEPAAEQPSEEASGDVYQSTEGTEQPEQSYEETTSAVSNDVPSTPYAEVYEETTTQQASDDDRALSPEESSGSAPAPAENVCEYREDGTYSDGSCTTLYHICTANVARFLACPTPLFYDSVNQKCTWGAHIEACKYHAGANDQPASDEQSGDGSGEPEATCDGKADGIYANGVCSTDFLTCSGGIARVMNCPPSLVFNPSIHVCDWPRDVAECDGHSKPKPVCEEDGYFSFGQCSSSFTACTNGRAIIMFCPAGLKFAEATQRCEYEADAAECKRASDEPATTTGSAYERASDDSTTAAPTTEIPYVPNAYEEPVEETTTAVVETTSEPASDDVLTSTTEAPYAQPSEEPSTTTTEVASSPASDEPLTTTPEAVYEQSTEEVPTTTEVAYIANAYEEPVEETTTAVVETTSEPSSDEGSAAPVTETYERSADEEPSSDATTVAPAVVYEQTTEETTEVPTTSEATSEQPSEDVPTTTEAVVTEETSTEGSAEEQNSCTGLPNGLYSVGCSPRVLSCQNGQESSYECPQNLVFNEQTSVCDYPQTSLKCQYQEKPAEDAPATPFDCASDGLFSDSLCSASYHQCSAGHLINFTCAEANAVFSVADATCVDSSTLLQCKSLSSPY